jgi:hypothetical protein
MNAVEIVDAVSALMAEPFNREEFPYQFLAAFGFKETTLKKLKTGASNTSDVPGAVLLRTNIHLATTEPGKTAEMLAALKASPKMAKARVKFVLATDGEVVEAEELATSEPLACSYADLADHSGFFFPLAGISTVAEIKDNPIDIKATGRLNKLYVELLRDNEDWATDAKRPVLNQFMARLIFCFFAEDTGIFMSGIFTKTLREMSDPQSTNTHEVIAELFRAMDIKPEDRKSANVKSWADNFRYVNGGLFTNHVDVPRFSKIARSYLIRAGELDWQQINPDIFGSMIQAVADDDERGSLGMHYTSVPNILKVLDPLFLDDLRQQLAEAGDNARKLLNLRKRIAAIRVFDPACGSGNFLVIAYIKMREIEAEIVRRRKDEDKKSWIGLTNFYGIEIKSFPAEIARLALLIAEFQCNVRHIGQREACLDVLPLHDTGKIVTGNALRLDWTEVCPPPRQPDIIEHDLADPTGRMASDGVEPANEAYICGNPPYKGSQDQTAAQKSDLAHAFSGCGISTGSADYVLAWFSKARSYLQTGDVRAAFVATNSVHQGRQVGRFWPYLLEGNLEITFAEPSFRWSNLASKKAAVTVSVIGLGQRKHGKKRLFAAGLAREVDFIGPYLVPNCNTIVVERGDPLSVLQPMLFGSMPNDGKFLLLSHDEAKEAVEHHRVDAKYIRPILGTSELTKGIQRYCIWLKDEPVPNNRWLADRIECVRAVRSASPRVTTRKLASSPHLFGEVRQNGNERLIIMSGVSSENRDYLPVAYRAPGTIVSNLAYSILEGSLWQVAILGSHLHLVWIATVCGKMKTDFRYSNTLGWNTFPVPMLTENDKASLTRCAEDIMLAREAHFPATIADLYDPEHMPPDLREAHDRNDETLERIYIGRRFKNDTERLEKLFDMYTKMIKDEEAKKVANSAKTGRKTKNGKSAATGGQK